MTTALGTLTRRREGSPAAPSGFRGLIRATLGPAWLQEKHVVGLLVIKCQCAALPWVIPMCPEPKKGMGMCVFKSSPGNADVQLGLETSAQVKVWYSRTLGLNPSIIYSFCDLGQAIYSPYT